MTEHPESPSELENAGANPGMEAYRELVIEAPAPQAALPEIVPSLKEQIVRGQLTGDIQFVPGKTDANMAYGAQPDSPSVTMNEADAARSLQLFLEGFITTAGDTAEDAELVGRATDLRDNLTYISEHQIAESADTMASDWKNYLDANPDSTLYLWWREGKSSQYVLDNALGSFNFEDLEKYGDRLRPSHELMANQPTPPDYKIIMVDDWISTGRQLKEAYQRDILYARKWPKDNPPPVEIQLVAADANTLQAGLPVSDGAFADHNIPVRSVHQARPTESGIAAITGAHSSTDDAFEMPIAAMVESLRERHGQNDAVMPPLTNIVRPYRDTEYAAKNLTRVFAE